MSKAVMVRSARGTFLVEVDNEIEVPTPRPLVVTTEGVAKGMDAVVDVDKLDHEFRGVKELIVTVCNELHQSISRIPAAQKVSLEFGVKLGGEAALPLITKVSGEGSFKVTVEWNFEAAEPAQGAESPDNDAV